MVDTAMFGEQGMNRLIGVTIFLIVFAFIIFGGLKRISHFTQFVVPFMALGYIMMALVIVLSNFSQVPHLLGMIVSDAFSPQATLGAAIGWGVKRGIYSNEAGLGTGAHAAAAAEISHPAQQGLVQAFSVYIDTLFVCTATALMILITQQYNIQGTLPAGEFIVQNIAADTPINAPIFTQMAVSSVFGGFGETFIAISTFFFAFTTLLAYYYIAEVNVVYLCRLTKRGRGVMIFGIKALNIIMIFYGAVHSSGYIWSMGEIGIGITAWLNIVGILFIFFFGGRPALKALRDYERQQKAQKSVEHKDRNYTFDPRALGIKNAAFWEDRFDEQQK